jgi:hypothetical protein
VAGFIKLEFDRLKDAVAHHGHHPHHR